MAVSCSCCEQDVGRVGAVPWSHSTDPCMGPLVMKSGAKVGWAVKRHPLKPAVLWVIKPLNFWLFVPWVRSKVPGQVGPCSSPRTSQGQALGELYFGVLRALSEAPLRVPPSGAASCSCPCCVQVSARVFGKLRKVNEVLTAGRGNLFCRNGLEATCELISLLEIVKWNLL